MYKFWIKTEITNDNRQTRQPSPETKDSGWENLTLTPQNSFFVYRFVSVVGNVVCVQFQNASEMGLPKTAYISKQTV